MEAAELVSQVRDGITVRRVFGDPIERDGVTVIPVARIRGGGGGGDNRQDRKDSSQRRRNQGMGFGLAAGPVGAYVIKDGEVAWVPALDVNRIVLGGQFVAVALFLVVRSLGRARKERHAGIG